MGVFFFFKQKTAYEIKECDWSSDVCSSDLAITDLIDRVRPSGGPDVIAHRAARKLFTSNGITIKTR